MGNQIFSFQRFGNYLMKYFTEYRSLRLQFIILTVIFTALMSISGGEMNFFSLSAAMYIFAIVTASYFTAFFSPRASKIKFLLIPVSQFEKFLAMLVHLYIYIPLMFAVMLLVAQYCATLLSALLTLTAPHFALPYAGVSIPSEVLGLYTLSYMEGVAFYLMGATIFKRFSFLKTTGLWLAMGMVFMLLMTIATVFHAVSAGAFNHYSEFETVNSTASNFFIVISLVVTILFLIVAYMRITEMEVNETKN